MNSLEGEDFSDLARWLSHKKETADPGVSEAEEQEIGWGRHHQRESISWQS